MSFSIIVAIAFALALSTTLYNLFIGDKKIEDEEQRKKKIKKDAILAIVWTILLIFRIIYIMHER
ncbi:hypothetical protein KZY75_09545 [Prevotella salivae]|jgi:hypothetical protein|uniref:Uncharacterized protein n=1 Tax=Segatella salivae TaxID=228604 RepID=A0AAW4NMZ0_9BACT|nr:hypothetical protein [Segatella salivae]MBW4866393.1 hypothetical protein [Segatella salivae]MBW4907618.1 hypothetical protein [Segatella salivae]MBW4910259.1 hypothetical protein [Segatella salivae]